MFIQFHPRAFGIMQWSVRFIGLAVVLIFATGCVPAQTEKLPEFLERMTSRIEADSESNSPGSIWRYRYNGEMVYYIPPLPCCDRFSTLYDEAGAIVCAPDGGIAGDGDGRCVDFFQQRTESLLVWKDSRVPAR